MKFIQKHKRLLIIVLIAIIIIGVAYYFTLGKELFQNREGNTGSDSTSGSGSSSTPIQNGSGGSFPLKWGIFNGYTQTLQNRLNKSLMACVKPGEKVITLKEDGVLGNDTLAAIKNSFPNIGVSVASNRQVAQSQYKIMIESQTKCA